MIFCFGGKEERLSGRALPGEVGGVDHLYLTRDAGKIGKTTLQNLLGNTERSRFPASADMLFCQGRLKLVIKIKSTALHKHSNGKIGLEDEKTEFQQIKMGKQQISQGQAVGECLVRRTARRQSRELKGRMESWGYIIQKWVRYAFMSMSDAESQ